MPSQEACVAVEDPAKHDKDPEASAEVEADLAADVSVSGDQALKDGQSDATDPVVVYRDLLQKLPEKISFLCEHCQDIVGNALDSNEAAEVLQRTIQCLGALREMELDRAKQPAEAKLTPCAA
jgi:hypothetical protein